MVLHSFIAQFQWQPLLDSYRGRSEVRVKDTVEHRGGLCGLKMKSWFLVPHRLNVRPLIF